MFLQHPEKPILECSFWDKLPIWGGREVTTVISCGQIILLFWLMDVDGFQLLFSSIPTVLG